jgi:hypothetical protein
LTGQVWSGDVSGRFVRSVTAGREGSNGTSSRFFDPIDINVCGVHLVPFLSNRPSLSAQETVRVRWNGGCGLDHPRNFRPTPAPASAIIADPANASYKEIQVSPSTGWIPFPLRPSVARPGMTSICILRRRMIASWIRCVRNTSGSVECSALIARWQDFGGAEAVKDRDHPEQFSWLNLPAVAGRFAPSLTAPPTPKMELAIRSRRHPAALWILSNELIQDTTLNEEGE